MARKLEVEIVGDARGYQKSLAQAQSNTSKFGKVAKAALIGGAVAGVYALGKAAKLGFDEFNEGQKVAAQTAAVLKSTGGAANVTAKEVDNLATALMNKSGMDDEAIKSGENMLLTFRDIRNETGKGNDIFNQATKATLDLSVAMGKDMSSSAILVGKALNDPIKGLSAMSRVGIQFSDSQAEMIKKLVESGDKMKAQKIILGELRKEFGGSAEAAGKTFAGQIDVLQESLSNTAGDIVGLFIPALKRVVGFISNNVLPAVQDAAGWIKQLFDQGSFSAGINFAGRGFAKLAKRLTSSLQEAFESVDWASVASRVGEGISAGIKFTGDLISRLLAFIDANKGRIASIAGRFVEFMSTYLQGHIREVSELGAIILVGIFEVLTDPAFWAKHWQLAIAVAAGVFPLGRVARLGGRLLLFLTKPVRELLGRQLASIGGKAIDLLLDVIGHFGPRLQKIFVAALAAVASGWRRWLAQMLKELGRWASHIIKEVPEALRHAFNLAIIFTFVGSMLRLLNTAKEKTVALFHRTADALTGIWRKLPGQIARVFFGGWFKFMRRFNDVFQTFRTFVGNVLDDIVGFFKALPGRIWNAIKSIPGKLKSAFTFPSISIPNPFGDGIMSPVMGGKGPGSINRGLWDDLALGQRMGLYMSSGYRPGAITSTGNPSNHGVYPSKAIDMAGSSAAMQRFFLSEIGRPGISELIHSPYWWHPGSGIQRIPASAGSVLADHYSHVHVGIFDKQGWKTLMPGLNMIRNNTGRPEPVWASGRGGGGGGGGPIQVIVVGGEREAIRRFQRVMYQDGLAGR